MNHRVTRGISILVAVLLLGCVFYAGALTHPYSGDSASYAVADESAAAFDSIVEGYDLETERATPVTDLSPETQRAFDAAKAQPSTEYENVPDGWRSLGGVPVCDDALLACDEYEEPPAFPREGHDAYESYGVVEADGGLYVVRTGSYASSNFGPLLESYTRVATLGSYAVFLTLFARSRGDSRPRQTLSFVGYGAALAGIALAYPYLVMAANASVPLGHFGRLASLALITWSVMLVGLILVLVE